MIFELHFAVLSLRIANWIAIPFSLSVVNQTPNPWPGEACTGLSYAEYNGVWRGLIALSSWTPKLL